MIITQISVFLENRPGTLAELVKLLADNGIDLKALSIAETPDYGIARLIVDDTDKAKQIFNENGWPSKRNHVLQLTVPDEPGSLLKILTAIADSGVNLEYSYAFYTKEQGNASIVMRFHDNDRAIEILKAAGIAD